MPESAGACACGGTTLQATLDAATEKPPVSIDWEAIANVMMGILLAAVAIALFIRSYRRSPLRSITGLPFLAWSLDTAWRSLFLAGLKSGFVKMAAPAVAAPRFAGVMWPCTSCGRMKRLDSRCSCYGKSELIRGGALLALGCAWMIVVRFDAGRVWAVGLALAFAGAVFVITGLQRRTRAKRPLRKLI